ncbi:Clavaminate synthase-like protein [Hygrophoropsis aurantiaca]|uniref:Clavaminate synthase-like protein n=1 Tax=Hygrophoropsis aurantiaca TaxID=72124 RepID=A0ACB8ASK0_9AGAM|nr:Clavaminate synthase-like protein [Hygrophoropsis aurantiaca]
MDALELLPIPLPLSANSAQLSDFGREVKNLDPGNLNAEQFAALENALYHYGILLFRNINLTPEQQYNLVKAFDPKTESYGHGNKRTVETDKKSPFYGMQTIPSVPQVQLIGHGIVRDHEGITEAKLQHPSHKSFHRFPLSDDEERAGFARFYHWHFDAAMYDLKPPKVTALYSVNVPQGPRQTVRYDDGTGDLLSVSLGATAFTWGKTMFDILPNELKSVAVRGRVRYPPHPFRWMNPAHAMSTGVMMETEGLEVPLNELPPWEEHKIQTLPMLWKNEVTGYLHLQINGTAASEVFVDPLPEDAERVGALYPEGAHLTDLKEVRDLLNTLLRPGIAPSLIYPHDWRDNDLVVFHNRGVFHSVVGAFAEDQVRVFHQSNLASLDLPLGPDDQDVKRWA